MTSTFEAIIEQKKDAIVKVREGIQELLGQPQIQYPPDEELCKCRSAELVFLIALDAQVRALDMHTAAVLKSIFDAHSSQQTLTETLKQLNKLDDSKGGASMGW